MLPDARNDSATGLPVVVSIRPRTVALALCAAICLLALASLAGQVSKFFLHHDRVYGLVNLFDLDGEANVPTWFSAFLLLACSAVLAAIGVQTRRTGRPRAGQWLLLSAVFAYMSADEASYIHELLNEPIRNSLGQVPPYLYYGWVLAGGTFVAIFGFAYLGFIRALPRGVRGLVFLSATVYVAGALLFDVPESYYAVRYGTQHFGYALMATVEEVMEMVGLTIFLYALLRYQAAVFSRFTIQVEPAAAPAAHRSSDRSRPDTDTRTRDDLGTFR